MTAPHPNMTIGLARQEENVSLDIFSQHGAALHRILTDGPDGSLDDAELCQSLATYAVLQLGRRSLERSRVGTLTEADVEFVQAINAADQDLKTRATERVPSQGQPRAESV